MYVGTQILAKSRNSPKIIIARQNLLIYSNTYIHSRLSPTLSKWRQKSRALCYTLTLKVLVVKIDAQWEGMGNVGSARYGTTSPMPDHKVFKLQ